MLIHFSFKVTRGLAIAENQNTDNLDKIQIKIKII